MSFKAGDRFSLTVQVTEKMANQFAELFGISSHINNENHKETLFDRRIAHEMISGALISRALAMGPGRGGIYLTQTLKFLKPIFINDVVIVEYRVISIREKQGLVNIETLVRNAESGDVLTKGEAITMDSKSMR